MPWTLSQGFFFKKRRNDINGFGAGWLTQCTRYTSSVEKQYGTTITRIYLEVHKNIMVEFAACFSSIFTALSFTVKHNQKDKTTTTSTRVFSCYQKTTTKARVFSNFSTRQQTIKIITSPCFQRKRKRKKKKKELFARVTANTTDSV